MSIAEKIELISSPLFGLVIWKIAPVLPGEIGFGDLVIGGAALLLMQALVRDLWLISQVQRRSGSQAVRVSRCICVESVVGISGILIGATVVVLSV